MANAQMRAIESSRARQDVLDRAYYPRFHQDSSVYARGTGARVDGTYMNGFNGLAPTTPNWAVGLSVEFPVFEFFSLREEVRIEQQIESREMARYDQVIQDLDSGVEQARAASEGARRIAENTPVLLDAARVLE
jgi:outer membrane protein TolC